MFAASPSDSPLPAPVSLQEALACIAALPLPRPAEAERRLGELLDRLIVQPPPSGVLFQILENAGDALYFVRETAAQKFQAGAPHLKPAEEALFAAGVALWEKVAAAYGLCSDLSEGAVAGDALDPALAAHEATVLHRRLYYTGALILDHYRAKRDIPAGTWRRFHACFRRAEEFGIAELAVEDLRQEEGGRTDCRAVWIAYLLLAAANPYSRDSRELGLVLRWACREAPLVGVRPLTVAAAADFVVLPAVDAPLVPGAEAGAPEGGWRLDTAALVAKIVEALAELQKGETPVWLGVGENGIGAALRLLRQLRVAWSLKTGRRRFRRLAIGQGSALVCTGFEAMHYFVGLNGRPEGAGGRPPVAVPSSEAWEVLDQSAGGFRLACREPAIHPVGGQLLAFLPHDGEQFLLGQVVWLKRTGDGRLLAGVAVLPGVPVALMVQLEARFPGQTPAQARAFLLPAMPVMGAPATLVLPAGLYRPEQRLATDHGRLRYLVPDCVIQSGPDFDRVSFRTA